MVEQTIPIVIGVILGWILGTVLPKTIKMINSAIQTHKQKLETDKNAFIDAFSLEKHPNGYYFDPKDKKRTPYCVECYPLPGEATPLKRTGLFLTKLVCPVCKAKYKL